MPAYNAEKTIEVAIKSILRQTYKNFYLVIVDDASTDETINIVKKFLPDPRVFLFENKVNMGAYYSRNYGLYAFKDKHWGYFTTHDADDMSYSTRYFEMIKLLRQNINAVQDMVIRKDLNTNKIISNKLSMAHAMFKRSVFEKIGYFDDARFSADWEYWKRLQLGNRKTKENSANLNRSLIEAYVHDNNLTVQIPEDSEERKDYVQKSTIQHEEMLIAQKYYRDFVAYSNETIEIQSEVGEVIKDFSPRIAVVLLSWLRPEGTLRALEMLSKQTYADFTVYLSLGDLKRKKLILSGVARLRDATNLKIVIREDGNDLFSFRRIVIGKQLAEEGTEIVFFLDDDITIPDNYIELSLAQYREHTYFSSYAWSLTNGGKNYYTDRTRQQNNEYKVQYCGAGAAMIDAKILLEDVITNKDIVPSAAYRIEDLWLSYCVDHALKMNLRYLDISGVVVGGADKVSLHKAILSEPYTKTNFLKDLVKSGWKIPKKPIKA